MTRSRTPPELTITSTHDPGKPELQSFDPEKTGVTKYPITQHQPLYFVTESFEDAKQKMM